jgi:autotransporter-associated beta strand protein
LKTVVPLSLALAVLLCGAAAQGATTTWNNGAGDGNWNTANNWSTHAVPGPADTANFNGTGGTITISAANATVLALTKSGPQTVIIAGPGTLTIGANGIARTGGNPANILTITANIVIGSTGQTWQIGGNGNTTTFSGALSGGSFTKTGAGILLLSGTNTFSGATINAGTVEVTAATALGAGTITLGSGSTLNVSSATALSLPVSVTTSGNSTLNVQGGAVTHSVASITDNNTLTLTAANGASLSVGSLTVNATVNGGPTLTVTGTLTGAGNLNSAVTVGAGANLTPVAGLRTGALTMTNTTNFNVAGTVPEIQVNGALVLDGVLTVTGTGLTAGTHALMNATGAITDNHLQIPSATVPAGFNIGTSISGGLVNLIVTVRPLELSVANVQAVFDSRHTQVTWTMRQEQKTFGYRLWKHDGASRIRVGPGLLPGGALRMQADLKNGPSYTLEDWTTPPGGTYSVEAVGMDGVSQWLGPVQAQPGQPRPLAILATDPSRTPLALSHIPAAAKLSPGNGALLATPSQLMAWNIASSTAAKISVNAPGVYRVSAESLYAAGIPTSVPLTSLSMSSLGNSISFRALSADGVHLNAGDAIEFYGEGIDGRYTDARVYWLTASLGGGPQSTQSTSTSGPSAGPSFLETLEYQDRIYYLSGVKNGGQQKYFGPGVYSVPDVRIYSTAAIDLTSSQTATLEVALQGMSSGQHLVQVSINGVAIGTLLGTGQGLMTQTFQVPSGLLLAGDNAVQLVAPATGDESFEIYQRLTYPRLYAETTGPLFFSAPGGTTVHLFGANAATLQVLDITDPASTVLVDTSADPSDVTSSLVNVPSGSERSLYAYTDADVRAPLSVLANTPSTIHSNRADLVVIAHSSLISKTAPLVAQRQAEGLRVAVVDVEDVYDEFANGEKDAAAIHDFLEYAWTHWSPKPRYALLVGSASYNPRNYGLAATVSVDLVPTPLVETEYMETGVDDALVTFSSTGIPDLAVGRLPTSDATATEQAIAKTLGRALVTNDSRLLFVQDEDDPVSNFTEQTNGVRNGLGPWRERSSTLARSNAFPEGSPQQAAADATLHASLLSALRSGPAMVSYLGHGNQNGWSGSILSDEDISTLAASTGTSVFFAGGCQNGYFVDEGNAFLAGALLSSAAGGAWAMVASSAPTDPGDQATLALNLWQGALLYGLPLGDALIQAKGAITDPNVRVTFELFGDPSARMAPSRPASAITVARVEAAPTTGCGTPGNPALAVLPLIVLAFLGAARARRFRLLARSDGPRRATAATPPGVPAEASRASLAPIRLRADRSVPPTTS